MRHDRYILYRSEVSKRALSERAIRHLEPFDDQHLHGLHTFCPAGAVTLIDGKRFTYRPLELLHWPMLKGKSLIRRRVGQREEAVPGRFPTLGHFIPHSLDNAAILSELAAV